MYTLIKKLFHFEEKVNYVLRKKTSTPLNDDWVVERRFD